MRTRGAHENQEHVISSAAVCTVGKQTCYKPGIPICEFSQKSPRRSRPARNKYTGNSVGHKTVIRSAGVEDDRQGDTGRKVELPLVLGDSWSHLSLWPGDSAVEDVSAHSQCGSRVSTASPPPQGRGQRDSCSRRLAIYPHLLLTL